MQIAREYVTYLARELTNRLIEQHVIETAHPAAAIEAVHRALQEEFGVEDRINDEARAILAQHSGEMERLGASYAEMFKKVKAELVRKHKVVL